MRLTNNTSPHKQSNTSQNSSPMQETVQWRRPWHGSSDVWQQILRALVKDRPLRRQAQAIQILPSIGTIRHNTRRYENSCPCGAVERRWRSRRRTRSLCGHSHSLLAMTTTIWSWGVRRRIPQSPTMRISVQSCWQVVHSLWYPVLSLTIYLRTHAEKTRHPVSWRVSIDRLAVRVRCLEHLQEPAHIWVLLLRWDSDQVVSALWMDWITWETVTVVVAESTDPRRCLTDPAPICMMIDMRGRGGILGLKFWYPISLCSGDTHSHVFLRFHWSDAPTNYEGWFESAAYFVMGITRYIIANSMNSVLIWNSLNIFAANWSLPFNTGKKFEFDSMSLLYINISVAQRSLQPVDAIRIAGIGLLVEYADLSSFSL